MVDEKRIEAMQKELAGVRSRMEELGPRAVFWRKPHRG